MNINPDFEGGDELIDEKPAGNPAKICDIAIVGMAARFPNSHNMDQFWTHLIQGNCSVGPLPQNREEELSLIFGELPKSNFIEEGYLDSIMEFEPELFDISKEEASYLDPQQRLLLELVEEAFQDGGYDPERIDGSHIGVYLSENTSDYPRYCGGIQPLGLINSVPASNVGRVAYTFDLRGPAVSFGAACASSLCAVHYACHSLIMGETNAAIAGGVRLWFVPPYKGDISLNPMVSKKQRICAFDQDADGIIGGEGGGILLLKRLDDAIAHKDHIHAVIKASAVASNGARSAGIAAPSETAQTELILRAHAALPKDTRITYMEAHGAGTKIGDAIEWEAMHTALTKLGYAPQTVSVGSVKANIGHLDTAAGIAGLIKVILMMKHSMIPKSANFSTPNQDLRLSDAPVKLVSETAPWSAAKKIAAISSLSLVGTNAHLILEEYHPAHTERYDYSSIVVLSAQNKTALAQNIVNLQHELLRQPKHLLCDIAFTLNTGRRRRKEMAVFFAKSKEDLLHKLHSNPAGEADQRKLSKPPVFVIPDISFCRTGITIEELKIDKNMELIYQKLQAGLAQADRGNDQVYQYLLESLLCGQMLKLYFSSKLDYFGIGTGLHVADYLNGRIKLQDCIDSIVAASPIQIDWARMSNAVQAMLQNGHTAFVTVCAPKDFKTQLSEIINHLSDAALLSIETGADILETIASFIRAGMEVDWAEVYKHTGFKKISLPVYTYNKSKYYLKADIEFPGMYSANGESSHGALPAKESVSGTEDVKAWLKDALNQCMAVPIVDWHADIYTIGLNSLILMAFLTKVKNHYDIEVSLPAVIGASTAHELISRVVTQIADKECNSKEIRHLENQTCNTRLSKAQERIYAAYSYDSESTRYNMTFGFRFEGEFSIKHAQQAINDLLIRHPGLRDTFKQSNGTLLRERHDKVNWSIEQYKMSTENLEDFLEDFVRPFRLHSSPLFRVAVVTCEHDRAIFFDMHHIIADGISMEFFLQDFAALYNKESLPKLHASYDDYVDWEVSFLQSNKFGQMREFWRAALDGYQDLTLSDQQMRTAQAGFFVFQLDENDNNKVYELALRHKTSPSVILLAIYSVLLSKAAKQDDVTACSFITGRYPWRDDKVVGLFVNSLPIRTNPSEGKPWIQYAEEVRDVFYRALENQYFDIRYLDRKVMGDQTGGNANFVAAYSFLSPYFDKNGTVLADGVKIFPIQIKPKETKFDLLLEVVEQKQNMTWNITYDKGLFSEHKIYNFAMSLHQILGEVFADSSMALGEIEVPLLKPGNGSDTEKIRFEFDWTSKEDI